MNARTARCSTGLGQRPGVLYDPFFLAGVAEVPALTQPDGLHPNAEGVASHRRAAAAAGGDAAAGGASGMRLFVALDLPWPLRQRVAMLSGAGIPGARWVPPENYHLTLRFIGETPACACRGDRPRAGGAEGAQLRVDAGRGGDVRQGRGAARAVGGRASATRSLDHLQSKIETALQRIGLEPERRRFAPHVTLARLDNRGGRASSRLSCRRIICSAPNRAGGAFYLVQFAAGQGSSGLYAGGGVRVGVTRSPDRECGAGSGGDEKPSAPTGQV